jgi:hypothetical protein
MKVSTEFLAAKKDKNIRSLIVVKRSENNDIKTYMRLCLDVPVKYTDRKEFVSIETETEIKVNNYSALENNTKSSVEMICFHCDVYNENFVTTFLKAIRKDSEINFRVTAYNGCDAWKEVGFVSHQLYGIVDNNEYFLSSYVGRGNSESPVQ